MISLPNNAVFTLIGAASVLLAFAADDSYDVADVVSADSSSRGNTSTKPFFMPAGCTCKISGASNDEQCGQFDCQCGCDVLAGACDINCCCDPECDSDDLASFSSCLDEGESTMTVRMCTESPPLLEVVNLKYPWRLVDSPEDKLHGLLCAEKDNSAVKGKFFEDQGYPRATQVFSPGGRRANQLGFHSFSREADLITSKAEYQLGDPIAVYQSSDQQLTRAFAGYLALPFPDDGGHCIELNTVAFGRSESNRCSKYIHDLSADCEGKFSSERYISNIFVEQTKGSAILGTSPRTNSLHPIHISTFIDSNGTISDDLDHIPHKTRWDNSSSTCINALKRMTYNVRYNRTTIVDISVDIETIDIETSTRELQQEYSVNFVPIEVDASMRSHEKNNLITRIRSGNPGYIVGAPTLGAMTPNVNQTTSYVIAQKAGFTVMDTGLAGQCSTSSPTGTTVGFAKNTFVGCTQSFTRDELRDFCLDPSNQHPMLVRQKMMDVDDFVFPKWLKTNQDMFGIFGNADPLQQRQWINIESPTFVAKSRSFIEAESRCIGMPSRLRFEILWTYVGNVDNPQAKILSAKKSFEDGPSLQHTLPHPNEKQPFSFITTVSWVFSPPKSEIVTSPPPLLIFSVPHDVFYPFQISKRNAGDKYDL